MLRFIMLFTIMMIYFLVYQHEFFYCIQTLLFFALFTYMKSYYFGHKCKDALYCVQILKSCNLSHRSYSAICVIMPVLNDILLTDEIIKLYHKCSI